MDKNVLTERSLPVRLREAFAKFRDVLNKDDVPEPPVVLAEGSKEEFEALDLDDLFGKWTKFVEWEDGRVILFDSPSAAHNAAANKLIHDLYSDLLLQIPSIQNDIMMGTLPSGCNGNQRPLEPAMTLSITSNGQLCNIIINETASTEILEHVCKKVATYFDSRSPHIQVVTVIRLWRPPNGTAYTDPAMFLLWYRRDHFVARQNVVGEKNADQNPEQIIDFSPLPSGVRPPSDRPPLLLRAVISTLQYDNPQQEFEVVGLQTAVTRNPGWCHAPGLPEYRFSIPTAFLFSGAHGQRLLTLCQDAVVPTAVHCDLYYVAQIVMRCYDRTTKEWRKFVEPFLRHYGVLQGSKSILIHKLSSSPHGGSGTWARDLEEIRFSLSRSTPSYL